MTKQYVPSVLKTLCVLSVAALCIVATKIHGQNANGGNPQQAGTGNTTNGGPNTNGIPTPKLNVTMDWIVGQVQLAGNTNAGQDGVTVVSNLPAFSPTDIILLTEVQTPTGTYSPVVLTNVNASTSPASTDNFSILCGYAGTNSTGTNASKTYTNFVNYIIIHQ